MVLLDRYFLDLALIESGSNRYLAPGSKWASSLTVSAAWVLSKENFMKNLNWVDFLKLRLLTALSSTDILPESGWMYYMQQYQTTGGTYPFNSGFQSDFGRTYLDAIATSGLTREKAAKFNAGVDATLFGGLDFSFDGF